MVHAYYGFEFPSDTPFHRGVSKGVYPQNFSMRRIWYRIWSVKLLPSFFHLPQSPRNIRVTFCVIHLYPLIFVWPTLPETNSSPLKINGWKMHVLLGWPIFRGYVSFREGIYIYRKNHPYRANQKDKDWKPRKIPRENLVNFLWRSDLWLLTVPMPLWSLTIHCYSTCDAKTEVGGFSISDICPK